jgi:hypothetical protein
MPSKYTHLDPDENPFSSKNYPFGKEWNKYSAEKLGRAFFSDGNVKSMGIPMVYDHIKLFSNSNFGFSNEPLYYKHYEIKLEHDYHLSTKVYLQRKPSKVKDSENIYMFKRKDGTLTHVGVTASWIKDMNNLLKMMVKLQELMRVIIKTIFIDFTVKSSEEFISNN